MSKSAVSHFFSFLPPFFLPFFPSVLIGGEGLANYILRRRGRSISLLVFFISLMDGWMDGCRGIIVWGGIGGWNWLPRVPMAMRALANETKRKTYCSRKEGDQVRLHMYRAQSYVLCPWVDKLKNN